jgi:hypothetical protein
MIRRSTSLALACFVFLVVFLASIATMTTIGGCVQSHTESDKDTLLGGHKHEETTTYKNPVTGDVSTEHKTETTK